jgi:alkylated DNA nucleotide flippase Atl1
VAAESRFESEEKLHTAISRHPEVLPSEDLRLGPLVTIANEIDFGHGPIDTLACDATGRLAIIEFKRGTENPDVRKVVAQVLDYGSSLWRLTFEDLEQQARSCTPGFESSLVEHVGERLSAIGISLFDGDAFRRGIESCLDTGEFVFLYVARNLDDRTKRIMTYLAEGPRMTFFAVEVDYFRGADGDAVLVPRVAFVPSWISEPVRVAGTVGPTLLLDEAPESVRILAPRLDTIAEELGLVVSQARASRIYRPAKGAPGVTMYLDGSKVEFDLESFRSRGQDDLAERILHCLDLVASKTVRRGPYPGVAPDALLQRWEPEGQELLSEYFAGRLEHIATDGEPQPLDTGRLHALLVKLPSGRWTTYGDVASAVGSHPRAVGGHISNCPDCENAWRVLQATGTATAAFRWIDPTRSDTPRSMLEDEGINFLGSRADPAYRLTRSEIEALII